MSVNRSFRTKLRCSGELLVIACVLLIAGLPAHAEPAVAPVSSSKAAIEETNIGTVAGYDSVRNIAMNLSATHAAFLGIRGKQQFVVFDGKPGPAYDWVIPESLTFSPDGARFGYLIQTAAETAPIVDGQIGKGFYSVSHNRLFWSQDGKRTALAVQFQGGGAAMVVDGVAGPKFDSADFPIFSADSKRIAYVANRDKKQFVVLDGVEQKPYDAVGRLTFSPNGKYLTYEAISNKKALLVLDAQEGKAYDSVRIGPGFSNDGARVVAVVAEAGKLLVVINGRESGPYEALLAGDFVLSPDGKHVGYAIKQGKEQFVMIDGAPQAPFDHVGASSLSFSPDSKRFVYQAGAPGTNAEFVVMDGVRQKDCSGILVGTPFFSPDSKRVAWGARIDGKWRLVVDGVEGKPYDVIEPPVVQMFSPDSQRLAYRAAVDNKPVAVVDGVESAPATRIAPLAFSPDSKHVAYLHVRDDKTYLVLDNVEVAGPYNPASPEMRIIFDDATTAHFIATRKDEFLRVKVKINP